MTANGPASYRKVPPERFGNREMTPERPLSSRKKTSDSMGDGNIQDHIMRIRALKRTKRKLQEIKILEEKRKNGELLYVQQISKIERKAMLLEKVKSLQNQEKRYRKYGY